MKIKGIISLIAIPVVLLFSYFVLALIWKVFDLPPQAEMAEIVQRNFDQYGLWVVFIGALIEGFLLLGQYFPGGFIIFLGVISAGGDIVKAIEVVLVVCVSFSISYFLNYLVGRYGWYQVFMKFGLRESIANAKASLTKHSFNAIISSYWEPNLASITATAAGIIQLPIYRFLVVSTIAVLFWNSFWGILVFSLGESAWNIMGVKYILVIFLAWVVVILVKNFVFDKYKFGKAKK